MINKFYCYFKTETLQADAKWNNEPLENYTYNKYQYDHRVKKPHIIYEYEENILYNTTYRLKYNPDTVYATKDIRCKSEDDFIRICKLKGFL